MIRSGSITLRVMQREERKFIRSCNFHGFLAGTGREDIRRKLIQEILSWLVVVVVVRLLGATVSLTFRPKPLSSSSHRLRKLRFLLS